MIFLLTFILVLLINTLSIQGVYRASRFGWKDSPVKINPRTADTSDIDEKTKMIFWPLKYFAVKYLGEFYSKPVATCPTCMASVHSLYVYPLLFGFDQGAVLYSTGLFIVYVLSLAGLNTLVTNIIDR